MTEMTKYVQQKEQSECCKSDEVQNQKLSVINRPQLTWTKPSVHDHYHNNTVNKTFKNATRTSSTIVKNNIFGYYICNCNVNKELKEIVISLLTWHGAQKSLSSGTCFFNGRW